MCMRELGCCKVILDEQGHNQETLTCMYVDRVQAARCLAATAGIMMNDVLNERHV